MGDKFKAIADKFAEQVRAAKIEPSTEISLIFIWAVKDGKVANTTRETVTPSLKVAGMGTASEARAFAHEIYVSTIIENIKRRLNDVPDEHVERNSQPSPIHLSEVKLDIMYA